MPVYGGNTAQGYGNTQGRKRGRARQQGSGLGGSRPSAPPKGQTPQQAAAAQPTAPMPDPQYEAQKASAGRNYAIDGLQANYQEGRIKQDYGFDDKSNPYSRAALLQENYNRSVKGTTNSYASQGQLYSGAYGRMQGENQRNYNIEYDQTRREYDDQLANIGFGRLESAANYGMGMDDASFQALMAQFGRR